MNRKGTASFNVHRLQNYVNGGEQASRHQHAIGQGIMLSFLALSAESIVTNDSNGIITDVNYPHCISPPV